MSFTLHGMSRRRVEGTGRSAFTAQPQGGKGYHEFGPSGFQQAFFPPEVHIQGQKHTVFCPG